MSKKNWKTIEHKNSFYENHWAISIDEGKYKGVVYQFDTLKFGQEHEDGSCDVTYNTIILENPYSEEILTEEEFKNTINDILIEIVQTSIEKSENESRANNTEESDL